MMEYYPLHVAGYRKAASLALLFACCVSAQARAEDSCLDIQRNYDLVKAEAVSVQTNAALFAAADSGCEDLARKLIGEGASVEARDARGAMPLTHAAREGRLSWSRCFWPTARRSTPAMSTAAPPCSPPPRTRSRRPSRCCWQRAPIPTSPAAPASRR